VVPAISGLRRPEKMGQNVAQIFLVVDSKERAGPAWPGEALGTGHEARGNQRGLRPQAIAECGFRIADSKDPGAAFLQDYTKKGLLHSWNSRSIRGIRVQSAAFSAVIEPEGVGLATGGRARRPGVWRVSFFEARPCGDLGGSGLVAGCNT